MASQTPFATPAAALLVSAVTFHRADAIGLQPPREALTQLASLVVQQSSTLGFADTMPAVALLAALVLPIVFAFPRSRQTTS